MHVMAARQFFIPPTLAALTLLGAVAYVGSVGCGRREGDRRIVADKTRPLPSTTSEPGPPPACFEPLGDVTRDLELGEGCTYRVENGDLVVRLGARLTLGPGTKIAFGKGAALVVEDGALLVHGDKAHPVLLTSTAKKPARGDWVGLVFRDRSGKASSLDHLEVRWAGATTTTHPQAAAVLVVSPSSLQIGALEVGDSAGSAVLLTAASTISLGSAKPP